MPRRRGGRRKVRRLPNDVLLEIFNKLPLNSIVRSKLVCKDWYSIISNPKFMHDYFKRIGKHFVFFENISYREFNIYDVNCSNIIIDNNGEKIISITSPLKDPSKWVYNGYKLEIIGSCNGLVALADSSNLILWNPITKNYKSVSGDYWFFRPRWSFDARILWALCYDDDSREYSVVVALNYQSPPASPKNFGACVSYEARHAYVVDFNTGEVRRLVNDALTSRLLDIKLFGGEAGKVVCGVPHWVVKFFDFVHPWVQREILYFDIKDDKFKQMPRPFQGEGGDGDEKTILGLATMEGERQLGIVLHHENVSVLEVWVMKEYGKPESWTNLFVIPYPLNDIAAGSIDSMEVLGYMPNGELLIQCLDVWWAHDLENGTSRMIQLRDDEGKSKGSITTIAYEPSLISNP